MIEAGKITFINAGAGSGKTFRLTEILYKALLDGDARPEGVIATTFTRKAAQELRERARTKLMDSQAWELVHQIGAARIGTVNGVCGELLQRFAFEAGISTSLRVLDERQAKILFRQALDIVLEPSVRMNFNVMSKRMGIQDKISKSLLWESKVMDVVGLARSNNIAANELIKMAKNNSDDLLSYFGKPRTQNPNNELKQVLQKTIPVLEEEQQKKSVINTAKYLDLCEKVLKSLDHKTYDWSDWVKLAKGEVGAKSKNHVAELCLIAGCFLKHPELHEDIRGYLKLVFETAASAMECYAQLKRDMGVIDFIDQEQLLLNTLEIPHVVAVITEELDLLMVDEFQDTSPIQLAIFLKLAAMAKKTYWVGDPKQSIYGFRGSDPVLMQQVQQQVISNEARENLGDSWRSVPDLVALSNAVFSQAFEGQYPSGEICLNAKREALDTPQSVFEHWLLEGSNVEANIASLANGVLTAFQNDIQVMDKVDKCSRSIRYSDIAILTKRNDVTLKIALALSKVGIPVSIEQPGLLGTPEAVLAIACLRRLNDNKDTLSTAEIVTLSQSESPESWLPERIERLKKDDPHLWRETGEQALPILQQLSEMRSELTVLSPREALQRVITLCNLAAIVTAWSPEERIIKGRLANLQKLLDFAAQYEDECSNTRRASTVTGLLLWLGELQDNDQDTRAMPSIDAVQVMTYHKAKGLEWPIVVCFELQGNIRSNLWSTSAISPDSFDAWNPLNGRIIRYWPWPFGALLNVEGLTNIEESEVAQRVTQQAMQEAQRLLYVGMTRARDKLVFALPIKDANNTVKGWLGSLKCEWLKPSPDTSEFTLPDASRISYQCEKFQAEDQSISSENHEKTKQTSFWFKLTHDRREYEPLTISPSSQHPSDDFIILEEMRLAERITLAGSIQDQMDRLGVGMHSCIAYAISQKQTKITAEDINRIMSALDMKSWVDIDKAAEQITAFLGWIQTKWNPIGYHSEISVKQTLIQPHGQVLHGQIDLLLELESGWILIDHKSNPGGSSGWDGLARKYGNQLKSYQQAIEATTGKPVLESWLYLPVSGGAIRIGM